MRKLALEFQASRSAWVAICSKSPREGLALEDLPQSFFRTENRTGFDAVGNRRRIVPEPLFQLRIEHDNERAVCERA